MAIGDEELKKPPVEPEPDMAVPRVCSSCGLHDDNEVILWAFKTNAWATQRQIIPYCKACAEKIARIFLSH